MGSMFSFIWSQVDAHSASARSVIKRHFKAKTISVHASVWLEKLMEGSEIENK